MEKRWLVRGETDYRTSRWSGGSTTQIAIAPAGAEYADRDFLWRVSSAVVELEQSNFTPLPDYRRLIATLEGEICLRHGDGEPLLLRPLHVHAFDGAVPTSSRGRCRDFNLMLRKGAAEGEMEAFLLQPGSIPLPEDPRGGDQLLYCAEGSLSLSDGERFCSLSAGMSLLTEAPSSLLVTAQEEAVLLRCRMRQVSTLEKPYP